jgi:transcriptional regulator with GAF, ATPase, and Fis domain
MIRENRNNELICWLPGDEDERHACLPVIKRVMAENNRKQMPRLLLAKQLPPVNYPHIHAGAEDVIIVLLRDGRPDAGKIRQLMRNGIKDVYCWCGETAFYNYLSQTVQRHYEISVIIQSALVKNNLAGETPVWRKFLYRLVETALYSQGACLLTGESGSGKELAARLIHTLDTRKHKKDLVLVDCTTIVGDLSGSEFFGHEKGAYTNALNTREGAFALANNGTLFLDEIGDLPLPLQAELLRVVQEGTYKKIGSNTWQKTEFRLVSATHRQLADMTAAGSFRHDLYYRISDFEIKVPSLREHPDDIPLLAGYFLRQILNTEEPPVIDDHVMEFLVSRSYPGNIRELRQLMRRIALRHVPHSKITPGDIPEDEWRKLPAADDDDLKPAAQLFASCKHALLSGASLWDIKNKAMEEAIQAALDLSDGNKTLAAEKLGVTPRRLQQFMKNGK